MSHIFVDSDDNCREGDQDADDHRHTDKYGISHKYGVMWVIIVISVNLEGSGSQRFFSSPPISF